MLATPNRVVALHVFRNSSVTELMPIIMFLFVNKKVLHCLTFIAFYIFGCYTFKIKYYTLCSEITG